jgi:hypothetical protein
VGAKTRDGWSVAAVRKRQIMEGAMKIDVCKGKGEGMGWETGWIVGMNGMESEKGRESV